ncbi:MAG: hypothetical protein IIT63_06265, partial [Prevotella sp.]|nr:hypothetical protein [Prevotella sp.]
KPISGGPSGFTNNFRIYWDGDLLEEGLDGASSREGAARVFKANGSIVFTANGTANCNWTKNTPSATGDVIGDWREEIIVRTSDNNYIRVYTTNIYTPWRNYTLWHDHQYRQGMVWESMGYNQPPHASYFLGELENITVAPPPLTMTGRVEIANGGTIGAANNDQHVIVCETNDTQINVSDGAEPHIATFNVPSWVQGTNSTSTTNPTIRYTYYNCTVTGGGFAGKTRLVKQGDGTLNLPNVEQKHSGNTDVWAGVVNFDGTMKNSSLWLNRFAELNSNGGTFRSIKMDYDAKLRPGRADNKGTITTDSLLLGFGSRVIFDIYDDFSADQINAKFVSIETKNWNYGPKYLVPVFEFVSHLQAGQSLPTGKYLIGEAENVIGNLSDIKIEGIGNSLKSSIVYEDGKLYLNIEGVRDATTVIWNGNENTNWDLATSKNFTLESDKEIVDEMFVTGDKVLFGDDANSFGVKTVVFSCFLWFCFVLLQTRSVIILRMKCLLLHHLLATHDVETLDGLGHAASLEVEDDGITLVGIHVGDAHGNGINPYNLRLMGLTSTGIDALHTEVLPAGNLAGILIQIETVATGIDVVGVIVSIGNH